MYPFLTLPFVFRSTLGAIAIDYVKLFDYRRLRRVSPDISGWRRSAGEQKKSCRECRREIPRQLLTPGRGAREANRYRRGIPFR